MEQLNLIKNIINNTSHTIESIAEILSLEVDELLLNLDGKENDRIIQNKITLFSDFLNSYSLEPESNAD
ncbi:MAG: hypothetical protein A3F46_04550 [Legionellales bacterium RIFCSPHIGHO2_12_FULL_42_9]|nr:MAG: hypothetical protein A3F46_04550 [Legionellales bacterium RIFCSPHIGHO2_12_FULL_42_9]